MSHHERSVTLGERPSESQVPSAQPLVAVDAGTQTDRFDWRGWLFGFVQRTFVMLVIYVLSLGPLYWQWYGARFAGGSRVLAAFYEPIVVLAALCPPFGKWMDWYVGLWIG